jgi:hypothetical protein
MGMSQGNSGFLHCGRGRDKTGLPTVSVRRLGDFDLAHSQCIRRLRLRFCLFLGRKDADFRRLAQWIISLATALVGQ